MKLESVRESDRMASVCSYKRVVCHHAAAEPSRQHKAQAERLWIQTRLAFCKSLSCLFLLGPLNSDIYILCPAEVSPACLRMPKLTLFSTQTSNIYRWRGKSSCTEGNVRVSADWWWIYLKKRSISFLCVFCDFFPSVNTEYITWGSNMWLWNVGFT